MIDPRSLLLIAGCLGFGALLIGQLYGEADSDVSAPPVAAAPKANVRATPRLQRAAPDELVSAVLARPLFNPTRRPPETVQTASSGLADKRLAGIVIEPDRRLAIFAVTGAKPITVGEGDTVDTWRIETITASEILLVGPNGSRTLQPMPDPAAAQARAARGNPATPAPAQPQAPASSAAPPAQAAPAQSPRAGRPPASAGRAGAPPAVPGGAAPNPTGSGVRNRATPVQSGSAIPQPDPAAQTRSR
jgi:hypothetical protein